MSGETATLVQYKAAPQLLDLSGPPSNTGAPFEYFANIMRHLMRDHGIIDRRWFIVHDGSADLGNLDESCVVFVYGDERSLLPIRYRKAGLILKALGYKPYLTEPLRADVASALDWLRIARDRALNRRLRARLGPAAAAALEARTLPFPLGYSRQRELPMKAPRERRNLVWFSGSLLNAGGSPFALRPRLADEPKRAARARMLAALRRLAARHPDWPIATDVTRSYLDSVTAPDGYSEQLMDTRIAVAPRGSVAETQRFCEAMRAGCAVICGRLPDFWFYRDAPAIRIEDWASLPEVIEGLVAAPGRIEALHEASIRWWREVACPAATAGTVAAILHGEVTVAQVRNGVGGRPG